MTAKEKAKELKHTYDGFLTYIESKGQAKQCTMDSIDKMLKVLCTHQDISKDYYYWNKVTREISKL